MVTTCFLELLRSGLWQKPADPSLFNSDTDWQAIYTLASHQAVTALAFDGLQTLPAELHPPRMLLLKWYNLTALIEQANQKMNLALAELDDLLRTHQIHYALLKGQGVAALYPHPLHRTCGDIDLYFGVSDFPKAKALFDSLRLPRLTCETEKHTEYLWKEIILESHHTPHCFNYPPSNRYLGKMIQQWYPNSGRLLPLHGKQISLPGSTFEATYLIAHIMHHLLSEGVGLRQVCDWTMLLHHEKERIDREQLQKDIRGLRLRETIEAFGYISRHYLGLPPEDLLLPVSEKGRKRGEIIWQAILQGGNFGKHRNEFPQEKTSFVRKRFGNYLRVCRNCLRFFALSPSETLSYPFTKIGFFTSKLWKK